MAVQIGAKPDSGFDDPVGMLIDCHRRIEGFLHILYVVANSSHGRALTKEEREAVGAALQYFSVGGQRHTADEEESLFPRLRFGTIAGSIQELDDLEKDHHRASDLHQKIETLYVEWIANGSLSPDDEQRLRSATEQLKHLYEQHIEVEERIVFPRVAEVLDGRTIAEIGREFHARRK